MNINNNLPNSKLLQNQAVNVQQNNTKSKNELEKQDFGTVQKDQETDVKSNEITADAMEILAGYNQISLNNSGKSLATGTSLTGSIAQGIINSISQDVKVSQNGNLTYKGSLISNNKIKYGVTEFSVIEENGKYTFKGVTNNTWKGVGFIFEEQNGKMVQIGSSVEKTANGETTKKYYDINGNEVKTNEHLTTNTAQSIISTISQKVKINADGTMSYCEKAVEGNKIKCGVTEFSVVKENGKYIFKGISNNIWKNIGFIFEEQDGKMKPLMCSVEKANNGRTEKTYYETNGMQIEVNETLNSKTAQGIINDLSEKIKIGQNGSLTYNGSSISNNKIKYGVTEFSVVEENGKYTFKGITNNTWKDVSFIFEKQDGKLKYVGSTVEKTKNSAKTVTTYDTKGKKTNSVTMPVQTASGLTATKATSSGGVTVSKTTAAVIPLQTTGTDSTGIQDKTFAKSVNIIASKIKNEKVKTCFMKVMQYIDEMSRTAPNTTGNNSSKVQINQYAVKTFMNYINNNCNSIRFYSVPDSNYYGAYYENNGVYITKSKLDIKENRLSALILHELTHGMLSYSGYNFYDESVTCLFENSYCAYFNKNYNPGTVGSLLSSLRASAAYKSTLPANLQAAKFCAA